MNSRPLFTIIFKLKNDNFKTRDFSPLIERVIAGVSYVIFKIADAKAPIVLVLNTPLTGKYRYMHGFGNNWDKFHRRLIFVLVR